MIPLATSLSFSLFFLLAATNSGWLNSRLLLFFSRLLEGFPLPSIFMLLVIVFSVSQSCFRRLAFMFIVSNLLNAPSLSFSVTGRSKLQAWILSLGGRGRSSMVHYLPVSSGVMASEGTAALWANRILVRQPQFGKHSNFNSANGNPQSRWPSIFTCLQFSAQSVVHSGAQSSAQCFFPLIAPCLAF